MNEKRIADGAKSAMGLVADGRYLGKGARLPCDDTPNDGDPTPPASKVRVYVMVGVPVRVAVMAGEGPEPMTAATD